MSDPHPASTDARRRWLALLVAAVATLPYLNTLGNGFAFDDFFLIRWHPMVTGSESPWHLLTWVQVPGAYRPLTMLSYAANERVSDGPFGYHLVNLCLHVLVSLGVFWLAVRLLRSSFAAAVAGLLFATHPVHTEAVSNVVGRAELLAAALVLGALLAFLRAERARRRWRLVWMALSLLAFAAACFAKESAFAAVLLFAITYIWLTPQWRVSRVAALLVLYTAAGAIYLGARVPVVGALTIPGAPSLVDNPLAHVDGATRLRTAMIVLWQYLSMLLLPVNLTADSSFNEIPPAFSFTDPRFALAGAALVTVALLAARATRRIPALAIAALFLVVPLVLTANVLFPIGTIKAERLLYLPSVGWCLAWGALAAAAGRTRPQVWAALLAVVVTVYAGRSWARNRDWKDNLSLFSATLAASPGSAKAQHNAATALQGAGNLDDALLHYRRALEIYPEYAAAAYGVGHVHHLRGNEDRAMQWYLRALAIDPSLAKAHLQIGLIRLNHGEYDAAEAAFRTGLETAPDDPELVVYLGTVLLAQGDRWRALNLVRYFATLPPTDSETMEAARYAQRELEVAVR